jgi:hypothetical protein
MPANTSSPGFVKTVAALILPVLGLRHVAQVLYPIIRTVAVDVVDLIFGPIASLYRPRNSMGGIAFVVDADEQITLSVNRTRRLPGVFRVEALPVLIVGEFITPNLTPKQFAGIRFVPQTRAKVSRIGLGWVLHGLGLHQLAALGDQPSVSGNTIMASLTGGKTDAATHAINNRVLRE